MTSWKKPTPELVARAIAGMRLQQQQRYFFEHLDNPEWIEPLRKEKYFSQLPAVTREGNTTTEYMWPASRYLARMALLKPDLVAEIMNAFPETDNPFVIQDVLVAADSMPAASAAKMTSALERCAKGTGFTGIDRAGSIATNLAQAGLKDPALKILRAVLDVVPDPRPVTLGPSGHVYRHEARTQIGGFDYGRVLRTYGERLTDSLGGDFLSLLSKKLEKALLEEYPKSRKSPHPVEDYSYIWRPNLEHWDMREEAKQLLISGILQASERMLSNGKASASLEILDSYPFMAFQRILFWVLAKQPDLDLELAGKKLTTPYLFHALGLRQEFDDLVRAAFPRLTPDWQAAFLALVDAAPDKTVMKERGFSDEQIGAICRQWTLERIAPIREYMTEERSVQIDALEQEFGAAKKRENPTVQGGAVQRGGSSPLESQDLQALSVDELLKLLRTWSPDRRSDPFGSSHQGLARELSTAITSDPERYLNRLHDFKTLQPTYVRSTLQGFREAARKGSALAWAPLLELAAWICEQPLVSEQAASDNDWDGPDSGWHPTRFAIVDILEESLKAQTLPVELGDQAWRLIDVLSDDPESECLAYDDERSQEKDVWSYSLNTLRPRAFRVALNYIEWLYNTRLKIEGLLADDIPYVVDYLDRHLDPATDKCLSVRLAYGEKFPFLHAHAPAWASRAVGKVFPREKDLKPLKDVAWSAFLAANRAYFDLYILMQDLYREAIYLRDDGRLRGKSHLQDRPSSMLAHHLVQLYWWGKIELIPGEILTEFLDNGEEQALSSAIVYAGQSLTEVEGTISPDVQRRLENLWDYILNAPHSQASSSILRGFGWWFNTKYFEDAWALSHLQLSLTLSKGKFEPILNALSRLENLARDYPQLTFDCTQMIALAADEYIELWPGELNKILETALAAGDEALTGAVRTFINELGRRGRLSYRTLLRGGASQ